MVDIVITYKLINVIFYVVLVVRVLEDTVRNIFFNVP